MTQTPTGTHQKEPLTATRYACFDVFDTVLTRAVGNPEDLFLLLGNRLLRNGAIPCSAEIFARYRREAEHRANAKNDWHPTLEQIHRELVRALELPASRAAELMAAELTLEKELLRRIPAGYEHVRAARAQGQPIVYITDTNFSTVFIREILSMHGLFEPTDTIFTSCEARVDKARGLLFNHVVQTLGTARRALTHHGNNATADFRNGRLSGLNVRLLPLANLNRYERALAAQSFATGGLSSLFAGSSRAARLVREPADERERTLRTVAAGVMSPLLTAWMMWTMRQAVRDGCRRLYFISRDGQVLLDVATRLERILQTGLELRYIYGSRQSLQFAGSATNVFRDLLRLRLCRMNDVIEALRIDADAFATLLPGSLAARSTWDRNLLPVEREQLRALLDDDRFLELLKPRAAEVRILLEDYYRQEGWADGVPFGLVDVGWRGSTAGALATTFADHSIGLPDRYYYFGLGDDAHRVAGPSNHDKLDAWFFDDASGHGYLPYLASTTSLIEMFCSGDHGAVRGFEREGQRVVPVLRAAESPMKAWGLPILRETTAAFVDDLTGTLARDPLLVDSRTDMRPAIRRVMELFWLEPTSVEVTYWGTYPVEANLNNSVVLPIAEKVSFGQIVTALKLRRLSLRSDHSWPHGSAMASAPIYRLLLRSTFWIKANGPQLRRRFRWLTGRLKNEAR